MSSNKEENKNEENWSNFRNWIHCICVVTFDLELGQALESIFPKETILTQQEVSNICYLAFPDSNSGCMGNTTFIIRLRSSPGEVTLKKEHEIYNSNCPSNLQINPFYYWGYVYFRQVKDNTLPRGYFQKSVVILTRLPFNNFFMEISNLIAPTYFEEGETSLVKSCFSICKWPPPIPGITVSLPLLNSTFKVCIPQSRIKSSMPQNDLSENQIQTSVENLNYFVILQPIISHIHLLWELVLTSEPLVVMASSPTHCSLMVLALTRIITPLKFSGDYRPYFTIHDSDFKQFTNKDNPLPNIILGVTNPFFAKTLHHWPHTIRLGSDSGQNQRFKLKKSANTKMLDNSPGLYTSYKPFLQKDKNIIKKIISGVNSKRPYEAQTALLKRHLLELTESFMIPLERYMASLMPLQKYISPFKEAPTPLNFNKDDFLATLETVGPQLTIGIKGDWIGLYRRFFQSDNFIVWHNMKHKELALKLQALQLTALADANLLNWVQGKPEIEVVDMIIKLKKKINECNQHIIPVNDNVKEQLNQRLNDIISSLEDDLKNILQIS